jgi:glutamine synthetase
MAMVGDRPSTDVAVTPEKAVEMARVRRVQIADPRFTDLFGMWQHSSIPVIAFAFRCELGQESVYFLNLRFGPEELNIDDG